MLLYTYIYLTTKGRLCYLRAVATSSKYTAWAMLATASAQVCVPLGHSSLYFWFVY